jgi:EAL domain-containing protein (putative c-di-GMP-specific phosphodiesterase class I)
MSTLDHTQPGADAIAAELGMAIERKRLRLYYQPIVSLLDRVAHDVEALPRWPRNGDEILAPPDFIGIAKQFDLLADLERWAIQTAFEQMGRWRRSTDLNVALNLSENHVYESDFADQISACAKANGVDRRRLSIEISETALVETSGAQLARLNELADLGVGLTIDDYSGEVPVEQLIALPTTALKISRRVVAGIPDQRRHTEIASRALSVGREYNLRVIANGVESPGQLAALRDMGCDYGQGFLFSIPMPAEVLAERTARR